MSDRKRADRLSPASVLGFLLSMPPDKRYDFEDYEDCACGQFLRSIGRKEPTSIDHYAVGSRMNVAFGTMHGSVHGTYHHVFANLSSRVDDHFDPKDWTFGKAAERLRRLMADGRKSRQREDCWTDNPSC